jgi:D-alanyl-D-alanine carboxypeptidase
MKNLVSLLISMISATAVPAQDHHEKATRKIDQLLEKELKKKNVYNVFMSVYSPCHDFEWHSAKGSFLDGTKVTIDNPFYTASIGKTFTATSIGLLVDQGKINFDDPIALYLSDEIMDGLHILNGVDYGDSITIAHLLQHTSGLPDYFGSKTSDGTPTIFDLIMTAPNRFWQPEELIAFSKAHFKPSFSPGSGYYYTDTEYVLLGMIIEEVSGLELHDFFSQHIFTPLHMKHTYLDRRSEPSQPTLPMAEICAGESEMSKSESLTADWAGGAIVSTGRDLIAFQVALFSSDLLSDATVAAMQQWVPETRGMSYGYGLRKIRFNKLFPTLPKWEVIGHSGLNGTSMYYCPDLDVYLAGTLNQLESSKDAVLLMVKVLMACKNL